MALGEKEKDELRDLLQTKLEIMQVKVVDRERVSFPSRLSYAGENHLEITMPRTKDGVPEVRVGDKLDIAGTLKNGQQLLFYAKVIKNDISFEIEKPSIVHVKWPDNFARKQLRESVRIDFVMKVYYSDELDSEMQFIPEKTYSGITVDISGGGTFVWTKEKSFIKNADIHLFVYIESGKQKLRTIIPCRVVIMKPIGKAKGGVMVQGMALNFTNLSPRNRSFLEKWIAEQQRLQAAERAERRRK